MVAITLFVFHYLSTFKVAHGLLKNTYWIESSLITLACYILFVLAFLLYKKKKERCFMFISEALFGNVNVFYW